MFLCLPWYWWMWSLASRDCREWVRVNSVFNPLTTPISLSFLHCRRSVILTETSPSSSEQRTSNAIPPSLACNAGLERDNSYLPLTVQRRVGVNHTCIVARRLTWLSSDNTHTHTSDPIRNMIGADNFTRSIFFTSRTLVLSHAVTS